MTELTHTSRQAANFLLISEAPRLLINPCCLFNTDKAKVIKMAASSRFSLGQANNSHLLPDVVASLR